MTKENRIVRKEPIEEVRTRTGEIEIQIEGVDRLLR